jgi:adenylosuccinate synthase
MKVDVLLGLQWGDEGKGKVVDVLAPKYDVVARFQGGPNAGHSLEFNNIKHVLHLIPSGIFHRNIINIIGNGVVIDPITFKKEIEELDKLNIDYYRETLLISKKAHLILPTHRILDKASEIAKGSTKIGSTLRGIGPAYMDKTGRNGFRVGDLLSDNYLDKYQALMKKHKQLLSQYDFKYDMKEYEEGWLEGAEFLKKFRLVDSEFIINKYLEKNKTVLAEGAQGTLLDIDFGSYPFVTSSNTITAGACTGLGIAPCNIGKVFGIVKAYCTRVGEGPFPTELNNEHGEKLREIGHEYGATTGRPRRCGWLDLVALKYAVMINGVTDLVMTKADVLSGFKSIDVCKAYETGGSSTEDFPFSIEETIIPRFTTLDGWMSDVTKARKYNELPVKMIEYIRYIEKQVRVPVTMISVGPDRDEIIYK